MRRFLFSLFVVLAFVLPLSAQDCRCSEAFLFLKAYMEKNYVGFKDKVKADTRSSYDSLSAAIGLRALRITKPAFCLGLMKEWLGFFRDGHNYLTPVAGKTPLPGPAEVIRLRPAVLASLQQRRRGIEGIYHIADSTYKIAIVKNKTADRDYAGVILASRAPTWKRGQVKLELKQVDGSHFLGCAYLRDHSGEAENFTFDGRSFTDGIWIRDGSAAPRVVQEHRAPAQSKVISDRTLYIGVGSFDESNAAVIDSLFRADSVLLQSTPNLILDLRGNGGGSDFVYGPISPWIYSGPVSVSGVDVLATDDNVKGWAALLDGKDIPEPIKNYIRTILAQMQAQPGQLVDISGDDSVFFPRVRPFPEKVVVLIDGACASSAEQFILEAMQSSKVTLMGQPTKGVLDYANVRVAAFPCMPFAINYATTRSRRVDRGRGIDNVGIRPAVVLGSDKDWVEEARRYLEQ